MIPTYIYTFFQNPNPPARFFKPFLAKPVIDSLPNSLTLKFKAKSNASPAPAPTTVPTGPPTKVPIAAPDNASTPEPIAKFLIF